MADQAQLKSIEDEALQEIAKDFPDWDAAMTSYATVIYLAAQENKDAQATEDYYQRYLKNVPQKVRSTFVAQNFSIENSRVTVNLHTFDDTDLNNAIGTFTKLEKGLQNYPILFSQELMAKAKLLKLTGNNKDASSNYRQAAEVLGTTIASLQKIGTIDKLTDADRERYKGAMLHSQEHLKNDIASLQDRYKAAVSLRDA